MLLCRVNFLDNTHFMWELERNAVGQELFNEVCKHLDLLESDYFGLAMWDSQNTRVWLDCAKEIRKQIKGPELEFFFNFKFYPPDPSVLAEDITRYLLCLQLRKDIVIGRLPCPSDMLAVLGSYTVQSTLGDYDPNVHTNNYVSKIVLAPNQNEELEKRVMEQHSTHRSMSPGQADMLFLEYAKTLPMYGVDLHPAKLCDASGADVMLGVCSEGLMVYEDEVKINSFSWPKVLKISHKRNTFLLKIRPSEDELDGDVSFTLPSYKACKQLWKCSVESHGFFRNRLQDTKAKKILTLGSRFRYHGRTQSECLEASVNINRVPPQFSRIATKRKANEEILEVLKQPVRTELDDWFQVHDSDKWDIAGTSDDVMLESKEVWESKQRADNWFVLLENSQSLQKPLQTEEERKVEIVEENESQERFEDELVIKRSYKVHVEQEGPVELKVMEELARDIMEKEHPELMGPMTESLTEEILQVNGERIQKVVITKQWAQEVSTFVEPQKDAEIKTERVETMRRHVVVTEGGEMLRMDSEEPSERLEIMEQRLNEVEAIEKKLLDVEELRVGLQELERLEQRLQQAERERLQQVETADWYILLDCSPLMLTAPLTSDEELEQIDIPKPMERNDDWYILLEMPPCTISAPSTDMISSIPGEDQAEDESREAERKIQMLLPEMSGEEATIEFYEKTREEVTQTRVKIEEEEEGEQVKVDYRSPQPVFLEQPQRDLEDDWFILLDVSPKTSVPVAYPLLRGTTVELYKERREEVQRAKQEQEEEVTVEVRKQQPVMLEQIVAQPRRDFEDDWFVIFDVSPKGSVPLAYPILRSTTVEVYEERRVEPESRAKVEYKQQDQVEVWMLEQRAVKPQRDVEDDWSNIFDVSHKETVLLAYPPLQEATAELYEESREEVLQRRLRREEREIEVMTVSTEQTVITEKTMRVIQTPQMFPVVPREIDDDWFQLFDQVPYEQKRFLPDARFEERKAMERRVKEEQLKKPQQVQVTVEDSVILEPRAAQATRDVEVDLSIILGVSPKESVPETVELYDREEMTVKTMRVIQTPQEFPVVPREIDDDWFQMFDPVPYEQRSFPSDVKSRDIWVRKPTKDQRVQRLVERVMEEQVRGKSVTTEERRVIFEERRERVDIMPQVFPVGVREVDDDWSELLDPTPCEKRAVPSVSVGTDEQRMKAREDIRVRQQEKRVRDDVEIRMRQEMRKQELDVRRSQPAVIVQTVAQPQREVEDDWFLLFDVSPKQTVVADVIKVDKRAEEVRRREVERRIEEERRSREEERKKQIKVGDKQKRPVIPETRPVRLQREVKDDWFTLMGVSPKDSVVSPVAMPKPRTQILVDQPLTSTPTAQPVSVTKTTYQDRTKDTLDITLESEAEESVSIRKSQRWTKRIEGESIYVRHSILMLEDFDVTQEVILRHHESVRELKRIFMEGMPDFGPTEWDRRLSLYSPTPKAQLPHANGEILISMGLIDDGKTVL